MTGLIRAALANRVLPNLLMIGMLVAGFLAMVTITMKSFPEIVTGTIQITVVYPGATPQEVVDAIIEPIEDNIESVEGIRDVSSTAISGLATVQVDLIRGVDVREALRDVEDEIDKITIFPDAAEEPRVTEFEPDELAIQFVVYGDSDTRVLKGLATRARDDLLRNDGISRVEVTGVPETQINIEVSLSTLRAYGISLSAFADRVRAGSLDLSGGTIEGDANRVTIRTLGERRTAAEFRDLVIFTSDTGARVQLKDVARVEDAFDVTPVLARLNGKPAVFLTVYRAGTEQLLNVVDTARIFFEQSFKPTLPDNVSVEAWRNEATSLRGRIDLLAKNAGIGAVLILIILNLFIDVRIAAWVAAGIVISFVGAFALMPLMGVTINQLSLFGFILALGIVVDDAIVVGEAVYRRQTESDDPKEAALTATSRVAAPVLFAVTTTICAFVPLLFLPGSSGSFIAPIAAVVIAVLLLSLVESFFVLPQHLSHVRPGKPHWWSPRRFMDPIRSRVGGAFERFS
ncbi:MAG: efflux RND transporter permease subunit, partial [Pseudomonadota bacterium]